MTRQRRLLLIAALAAVALAILAIVLSRQRVRRHRVFHPAVGETKPLPPRGIPPVEQWSVAFQQLGGDELVALLDAIEKKHPDLYAKWSLAYLHARSLVEAGETERAIRKLEPFLRKGHPFRDRALHHRASIAENAEASRYRNLLIFEHEDSPYRDEAIDDELAYLDDAQELAAFAEKIAPSASTERRREISARIVEKTGSLERGLAILKGGTTDDAADRAARALDRAAIRQRLTTEQLALLGETFQQHRHFDRAIVLLRAALKNAYSDDLQFALGRSHFGAEEYEEAQAVYLRGAGITKNANQKATFFWHAARAAQLRGDDAAAERLMTQAIAVKGKFPATTAALTQRLRTRLNQKRFAEAASDLALLRRIAPNERAVLEGSLAYAVGMLAAGRTTAALSALNSVPPKLLNDADDAEFGYWRARALEGRDRSAAIRSYLEALRSKSHFAHLARQRLSSWSAVAQPPLSNAAAQAAARRSPAAASESGDQGRRTPKPELTLRDAQVKNLLAANRFDLAKRIQTDRVLLSTEDRDAQLRKLADIYRRIPAYREVLELKPRPLPRFPNVDANDPAALLMAMGFFDEAESAIEKRWGLRPQSEALTRAYALHLGGASRSSIYAVEVLMRSVPRDFHHDLLPSVVQSLLYPRYFQSFIVEDANKYGADPTLLLSIMREESRFDPRAKSQAAARGLLQFIITTARDIGRDVGLVDVDPEDLYDPRVIIRLGAKYVSELSEELDGNRYRVAAAYNAGPKQVALWTRMQSAPGDDYFLTAVNFDETKGYVNKVMNSYERYAD